MDGPHDDTGAETVVGKPLTQEEMRSVGILKDDSDPAATLGLEGSHLPVGRLTPIVNPSVNATFNTIWQDVLLRQLINILDSVFTPAARGSNRNLLEEAAYQWHKGRLRAEDDSCKDVDSKDFGYDIKCDDETEKG